jgi:L-ascorbate metabolism protein UlaG (beta-lactamase superfamily)
VNGVTWLGHSTVLVEIDGSRLLTDPVLRRRIWHLRRDVPIDPGRLGALSGVLISHTHFDHLDLPSLARLDPALPVVAPAAAVPPLRRRGRRVLEAVVGQDIELGAVRVRTTHAEHESRRGLLSARSPSVGFIVEGSATVYFAGDTDLFDGMRELGPVDVALLPVAGWGPRLPPGHLSPRRAAQALRLVRPRVAVPIHWGTFRTPLARRPGDLPAREFARAAAELAPDVDVRVLAIGESLAVEPVAGR